MAPLTRGPLPARVYWTRRVMVLGTAVLLVIAIGRLLGNGSDASSPEADDTAAQVAADSSPAPTTSTDPSDPSGTETKKPKRTRTPDPTPTLAVPVGECADSDIAVTPVVEEAVGGRDVTIVLQLRTLESPACTWNVGPSVLTMDITSGSDDIWSSRQCPGAIPKEPVVVRQAVTSKVEVVWKEAKRSGEQCTRLTDWAMPGWYHVTAAALGGEPADVQFQLTTPTAETVTQTASPTQTPSGKPSGKPGQSGGSPSGGSQSGGSQNGGSQGGGSQSGGSQGGQQGGSSPSGSPSPSGAVEPNG